MDVNHGDNIQFVFSEWVRRFHDADEPCESDHVCPCDTCSIVNVRGSVYKTEGGGRIAVFAGDTVDSASSHVCDYNRIYVCLKTMIPHWCCGACEYQTRDDYGYVCTFSGLRSEATVTDTWIPQYRISATAQECKDPKSLGENIIVDENGKKIVQSTKHVDYAADVVYSLMFSTTRCYAEQRKYAEQRVEAEKNVLKYMRVREQQNLPAVYTDMVHIYIQTMKARRIFFALVPKMQDAKLLSRQYAKRICAFWRTICNCTPLGQQSPNSFAFVTFVTPALYMMRRGLFI